VNPHRGGFHPPSPALYWRPPNSNVNWAIGSTHNITWSHNLRTDEAVNLEVSRDGGATWTRIASDVMNSGNAAGSFSWTVSGPATTAAGIRVV
jgi:hypothetical protein